VTDTILTQRADAHLMISIDRPDASNRMTDEMILKLTDILRTVSSDISLVTLSATGADFCLGWGVMAAAPAPGSIEAYSRRSDFDVVFDCYSAFRACEAPILGLVQGRAYGFGCAIAALCDLTIASDDATFCVPEMTHNIMPTMVMSALIDRVALKTINHLVLTCETIGAAEAKAAGLVTSVVPAGQMQQKAEAIQARILGTARPAVQNTKEFLRSAINMDVGSAVQYARNMHATVNTSSLLRRKH
jgi:enoyl-CoA hydratase